MASAEDLRPPQIPPRSRLYSLPPIGVGTPEVESLESYTLRLALAHGVTPGVLMTREIARLTRSKAVESGEYWDIRAQPHSVNGMDLTAFRWISALEYLTRRNDLSLLTLRSWRHVLPRKGLIRKTKAWCPHCYEQDSEPYERLLWSLQAAVVCVTHRVSLTTQCPHCSAKLPMLGFSAKAGICIRCGTELNRSLDDATSQPVSADSHNRAITNATQLGNLLASAAWCDPPARERIPEVIAELRRLCELHGVRLFWEMHKKPYGNGNIQPSLSSLLLICENAGVSLSDLMTAPVSRLAVSPKVLIRKAPTKRLGPRFDVTVVGPKLRKLAEEASVSPPSLHAAAVLVNANMNTLRKFFPEFCRTIIARHREFVLARGKERRQRIRGEILEAATKLATAGIAVTEARVTKSLKQPGLIRDRIARQALRDFITQRTP